MPITQRLISRDSSASYNKFMDKSTGEELLSDKTFAETVGCLRQLSDLALFANEVFTGLLSMSVNLNERIESLKGRSAKLQVALPKLVVTQSAFDIHGDEIQHHRQMLQNPQSQHLVDRSSISSALLQRYGSRHVKPRIQFHTLDSHAKYFIIGPKSKTIAQRYSNPDFFLNQWCTVQVARMKQLEREKKQQKDDKKKRKEQRVAEVAFEQRIHKRKSSVKWQERYMVDGKAVNRKSLAAEKSKGKRLSLMTSNDASKPEEPEEEAEDGDSLPSTPAHSAKHASPRRPFQAPAPPALDLPPIPPGSVASWHQQSGQATPLVRYSAVYEANESEGTPLDSASTNKGPPPAVSTASATAASKPTPPPPIGATKSTSAPPPPPPGATGALPPRPLPPKMPAQPVEPERIPLPPVPITRPVAPPAPAPPVAAVVPPAATAVPPPPSSTTSSSSSATTVDSAPPPPPAAKVASPPPPPIVPVVPTVPSVPPAPVAATNMADDESDRDSEDTEPEFIPKPAPAVGDGDSDGDSEVEETEVDSHSHSQPVPATPQAKHYLQDLMSVAGATPVAEMFGMLLGTSRPAPPPPPPPPVQSANATMTPQKGESASTKTLLKPRPISQNVDSARSKSRSSMRLASTDSVSSQLQALSYNLAGIMVDNLEEVPEHEQEEEEEIDAFAAVNSTQASFAAPPPPPLPPAAAFGRMNLMDAIKQGGGGLRKTDEVTTPPRPSTGRESLLDAIKKGGGGLRHVSTEEKHAREEEKQRGSGLGGFAASSVTAILERRKFLMAEESDSDSDNDDEEWS